MKKKTLIILALSMMTIFFTSLASSTLVEAATADDTEEGLYFSTTNSASYDFPITLNVAEKTADTNVGTAKTGFMTSGIDEKVTTVSIVLPIIICIVASLSSYFVLRHVKFFKQKNSDSFGLSSGKVSKISFLVNNPALLLAICFGLGCSIPTFFLQSDTSRADTEEITDLDYDNTDFNTFVKNSENPYKIAIAVSFNHMKQSSKTDAEEIEEDAEEESGEESEAQPKSERKIEDNGEFIVGSVDATFLTYNYSGYVISSSMKSGVTCSSEESKAEDLATCVKNTNLVSGETTIPSISKAMNKADFEKLETAAWGWSDDGETYYPLYWAGSDDTIRNLYADNQTIYFAVKITSDTPAGEYKSADNFQITAQNESLKNEMFDTFKITYKYIDDDDEEKIFATDDVSWPLFLKDKPGKIAITSKSPDTTKCREFLGWSEKTQAEYDAATDKATIKLYNNGDKYAMIKDKSEVVLYAIWAPTTNGCLTYEVYVEQNATFSEAKTDEYRELVKDEDGNYIYEESEDIEYTPYDKDSTKAFTFTKTVDNYYKKSTLSTSVEFDLLTEIGVPELNGYTFKGWSLLDCTSAVSCPNTLTYLYDSAKNSFYLESDATKATNNIITMDKNGKVILSAIWSLNQPKIEIVFWEKYEEDESKAIRIGTKISDDNKEWDEESGGWFPKSSENDTPTIYEFDSINPAICENGAESCDAEAWYTKSGEQKTKRIYWITADDDFLDAVDENNADHAIINLYKENPTENS